MSGQLKRAAGWALCGLGCLTAMIGVWAIGSYIWGVVSVINEPDQSWMFWGLAIFFIGLAGLGLGIGIFAAGRSLLKSS